MLTLCGALRPGPPSPRRRLPAVVACSGPEDDGRRLAVCRSRRRPAAAALGADALAGAATYVAVCGPQFETPAEAAWLSGYGDVVGMSAAPEVRAAAAAGVDCCLVALVANRAGAAGSHGDVLLAGRRLAGLLAAGLARLLTARWPEPAAPGRE